MHSELTNLLERVLAATGSDAQLDARIAALVAGLGSDQEIPAYTGSVDRCLELIHQALPGWGWHVGYGPRGVIPYATVTHSTSRHEASAPTVPLALLTALLRAKVSESGNPRRNKSRRRR